MNFFENLDAGLVNEFRDATNGNFVLGDKRFKEQISNTSKKRVILGKAGRPVKKEK